MEVCLVLVIDSSNDLYKYSESRGCALLFIAHVDWVLDLSRLHLDQDEYCRQLI